MIFFLDIGHTNKTSAAVSDAARSRDVDPGTDKRLMDLGQRPKVIVALHEAGMLWFPHSQQVGAITWHTSEIMILSYCPCEELGVNLAHDAEASVDLFINTVLTASLVALFLYWFRYGCLLILAAETPRDYSENVARANQLSFPEVLSMLRSMRPQTLIACTGPWNGILPSLSTCWNKHP